MLVKGLKLLPFLALAVLASGLSFAQVQPPGLIGATDLKSIVLSPAPLGPPAQFEPAPATIAESEAAPAVAATQAPASAPAKTANIRSRQKAAVAARKSKAKALDSFARDAQRQTWPCTGGGICAWTNPPR